MQNMTLTYIYTALLLTKTFYIQYLIGTSLDYSFLCCRSHSHWQEAVASSILQIWVYKGVVFAVIEHCMVCHLPLSKSPSADIFPCSLNHHALPCQCQSDLFTYSYVEPLFRHMIQCSLPFPYPLAPKEQPSTSLHAWATPSPPPPFQECTCF